MLKIINEDSILLPLLLLLGALFVLNSPAENQQTMKRLSILLISCSTAIVFCSVSGCKNKSEASKKEATSEPVQANTEEPKSEITETGSGLLPDLAKVKIKTNYGDMLVALYNETPLHRDNFLKLAEEKYYDGLLFHRCIRNFMIQGGDPASRGAAQSQMLGGNGPGYTVPAEFRSNLVHKKGALSAARQGDQVNPQKASSGSQFYIVQGQMWNDMQLGQLELNCSAVMPGFKYSDEQKQLYKTLGGTAQLDMSYTVFGEVIQGMDVLDSIAAQPTAPGDRPLKDVVMTMVVVQKTHK